MTETQYWEEVITNLGRIVNALAIIAGALVCFVINYITRKR